MRTEGRHRAQRRTGVVSFRAGYARQQQIAPTAFAARQMALSPSISMRCVPSPAVMLVSMVSTANEPHAQA